MKIRYVLTTAFDQFTHHVGDTDTLKEIIKGLTDDLVFATRIATIANYMQLGDGCEEDK